MIIQKKRRFVAFISSLLLFLCSAACNLGESRSNKPDDTSGATVELEPVTKTETLLGTICKITIYDKPYDDIFDKAFDKIRDIENKMSTSISDSEVSKINAKSGQEFVKISDETVWVIKRGIYYSNLTNGLFDISIGPLVNLWKIGTPGAKVPSSEDLATAKALVGYKDIVLDENAKKVMLKRSGMSIDLGGIGKGYAADAVADVLRANGVQHAIINLGGNILALGEKMDGSSWKIGIQNPYATRGNNIGIIEVINKSVVTSGTYERYFEEKGKRYHHILNPLSGYPYENDLAGITIITENSIDADGLSTSAFALGLKEGYKFIESLDGVEAIFITNNSEVYVTTGYEKNFKLTDLSFNLKQME